MLPRFLAVFVHKLLKFTLQYFLILKKKQTTHLKMPIKFLRTSTAERNKCFIGKQLHCGTTRAIFTSLSPAVYFSFRQRSVHTGTPLKRCFVPHSNQPSHFKRQKKSSRENSSSSPTAIWADGSGWCDLGFHIFQTFRHCHKMDTSVFLKQIHFLIYSQDDTVRNMSTNLQHQSVAAIL